RIETKGGGDRLGRSVPGRRQASRRAIDREAGDAVVAAVADVEEPTGRREVDLRTGIAHGDSIWQRSSRLHGGQRPRGAIDAVGRDATPLLVREVCAVERGMKAEVTRPDGFARLELRRRVGAEAPAGRIEAELRDEIGAGDVLRRLEDVVLLPRDV